MASKEKRAVLRLDVLGLFLAGLINTFLALLDAGIILGPGTGARQSDLLARAAWIAEHSLRWQGGWLFWFAVTLSFAWSFYALGRHLDDTRPWRSLAIGVAVIAAAVDLIGVLVNLTVLPEMARALASTLATPDPVLQVVSYSMENLANALTNVAAFATPTYPRGLVWLATGEWGIAAIATGLLVLAPAVATGPLLVSFALYAPWVWGSGLWLLRGESVH